MDKRHGAGEEHEKDDRVIDEDRQSDNKMNPQGHQIWTLIKIMHVSSKCFIFPHI